MEKASNFCFLSYNEKMKFVRFVSQFTFFTKGKEKFLIELEKNFQLIGNRGPTTVATPNPEQLIQAWENPEFASILKKFDYLLPDGVGLVWLSQTKPQLPPIQQKIAGIDVVSDLLALALKQNWRVLVLGGRGYENTFFKIDSKQVKLINIKTKTDLENLNSSHESQLFWLAGFQDFNRPTPVEKSLLTESLQKLRVDLIFVAFGAPKQELWIQENLSLLKSARPKLIMAVGGSFDILLGKLPRAPKIFRSLNLEWLWRLILQPTRIKRQLRLIKFVWLSLMG